MPNPGFGPNIALRRGARNEGIAELFRVSSNEVFGEIGGPKTGSSINQRFL